MFFKALGIEKIRFLKGSDLQFSFEKLKVFINFSLFQKISLWNDFVSILAPIWPPFWRVLEARQRFLSDFLEVKKMMKSRSAERPGTPLDLARTPTETRLARADI